MSCGGHEGQVYVNNGQTGLAGVRWRAGGLAPGLALSGPGWMWGWLPKDAFPGVGMCWWPQCPAVTQDDHFPWPSGALLAALPVSHHGLQRQLC